ncbi:MAG: alpha/beta fold hydrolase, partial [Chloroflexota bacterium]
KSHPAIRDATVFGVPHTLLSEDLAAAVVSSDPALTPKEVRKFVSEHLSPQKVPAIVLMVDEIPRSPIGKVQRSALPQLLGLVNSEGHRIKGRALFGDPPAAPRNDIEQRLVRLWSEILVLPEIGIDDDFFDLGGTSLQAAALVTRIAREFHTTLSVDTMFEAATVAEMADVIARPERDIPWPTLVPIQPSGTKPPFFCLPGLSGVVLSFRELALHMGSDQPVYGLQPPGMDGKTPPLTRMEDLAAHFVQAMRSVQPNGPYMLGGYSFGGMVALEVARILRSQGEEVALLASFDGPLDVSQHPRVKGRSPIQKFIRRVDRFWTRLAVLNPLEKAPSILGELKDLPEKTADDVPVLPGIKNVSQANGKLTLSYQPKPYEGEAVLFSTQEMRLGKGRASFEQAWEKIVLGGVQVCDVPGDHDTILHEPFVQVLAEKLSGYIERVLVVTGES